MLSVSSDGPIRFCDGVSRRHALQVGALGSLGLGLPGLLEAQAAGDTPPKGRSPTFGQAKRVILLFMWGGPAHQDTWDLKPDGPVEQRGEFLPIATSTPGLHISEHFPLIARHADKLALIRSVAQEDNNHSTGAHAGLTGRRHERKAENFAARASDFPHYGSVLSKLRPNTGGMPTFVALPDVIATTAGAVTPGQGGGIIGRKYDPFQITDHPDERDFSIASLKLPSGLTAGRFRSRRDLMQRIDGVAKLGDRSRGVSAMGDFYRQALDMVLSPAARKAFDLDSVADRERWRYGWHTFGQSVLMARRLIEAGVKLVTVYWHREVKTIDTSWDTHSRNFTELRTRLMPAVDRPIAALLEDLQNKGLLDETLIVWNSEFGRTPKVNRNGGRDHWGACNTAVMAGGGVPGGQVFGASDKAAAYPTKDKVTQDDIAATIYHLLGFDPETPIYDRTNRPNRLALGKPMDKLLGERCRPEKTHAPRPIVGRPTFGPFHRMLRERGRRFLCCELGNSNQLSEWKLAGWSAPQGTGLTAHRTAKSAAAIEYTETFYAHFAYSHLVFRLAEPAKIDRLSLSLNGKPIPVPADLAKSKPTNLWHVPFPDGMIKATKHFRLRITCPGWQLCDVAIVGDRIRDIHVARIGVV
ncbi:MAG: DUF1501 domain-containing protein [Planctomycetaceae bacterium]